MTETHATPSARLSQVDWDQAFADLDTRGHAVLGEILSPEACAELVVMFEEDRFRKHIVMEKHSYGLGQYKYFSYPLPGVVQALRETAYPFLVGCANRWSETLDRGIVYPASLGEFLEQCHAAGQCRPTPLILRYEAGGYNRLHQDLYGNVHFPIQLVILLSEPGSDFTGGEIVLTEQRARVQARPSVVELVQGHGLLVAVNERPTQGVRGPVRVAMRHGVSEIHTGERYALGVIFHDAE